MLANIMCWAFAIGIIVSKSINREDLYTKLVLAMGFIFLGTLSKAVDVYRDIYSKDDKNT